MHRATVNQAASPRRPGSASPRAPGGAPAPAVSPRRPGSSGAPAAPPPPPLHARPLMPPAAVAGSQPAVACVFLWV
jgi:hypothetical protein